MSTTAAVVERDSQSAQEWGRWLSATGSYAVLAYLIAILVQPLPWAVGRLFFYTFGPAYALALFALGRWLVLRGTPSSPALQLGVLAGVVAGAIHSLMAIVQDVNFTIGRGRMGDAADEQARALAESILWGVNNVQGALDLAFDVWISLSTLLLALVLRSVPGFGWVIAGSGVLVAVGSMGLNMVAFPADPGTAGFPDPGAMMTGWYSVVLVTALVSARRSR